MIYKAKDDQVSYGEAIGILMLDTYTPFIPGDVGNATTYDFPVRYKTVEGLTVERMLKRDPDALELLIEAGKELEQEGVRAITMDCGISALFQDEVANQLDVPVFLSSLLQAPFISRMLADDEKMGLVVVNSDTFNDELLKAAGIEDIPLKIKGVEDRKEFYKAAIKEVGRLDDVKIKQEIVTAVEEMIEDDPKIKAILLECSVLPPYGPAVQKAVNLPVFDYVTMINYIYSTVVKPEYEGYM